MKNASPARKTVRDNALRVEQRSAAGPDGQATVPPAYGLALVDNQRNQENPGPDLTVQAKLRVTAVSEATEREADKFAKQIVRQINRPEPEPFKPEQSETSNRPTVAPKLQAPVDFAGGDLSTEVAEAIQQAKGGGKALDSGVRSKMERAFGSSFSDVRVHTDARADSLNRHIQADAFTSGQDIFFRQGQYNSDSRGGQQLIAHELTHVVQQSGSGPGPVNRQSPPDLIQRKFRIGKTSYDVKKAMDMLKGSRYRITEENMPGLRQELVALSKAKAEFKRDQDLTKHLRAKLWITAREPDAAASLDEEDQSEQLLTGMEDLQELGLKYEKPQQSKMLQKDFWQQGVIAPYVLNCWQTVLLAAYRQGLIDHKTFKLADKSIQIGGDPYNVMSELIARKAGDNKFEWDGTNSEEVADVYRSLAGVKIPEGWVIVIGRGGGHVGVSTGNVRSVQDEDTKKLMPAKFHAHGHEWIENDKRKTVGKTRPVSDLRVSTLEDAMSHYVHAGGVYWAPLPTEYADYVEAEEFLLSLQTLVGKD